MDAWIFANGVLSEKDLLRDRIVPGSLIVAADGGMRHIRELGLIPQALIGDLDSISEQDYHWAETNGVQILRYPTNKDETDLELALDFALKHKPEKIQVAGAIGGRIDQSLGNIFLLGRPDLANINIRLEDGLEEIFLIREYSEIQGKAGDIVSLLPISAAVDGVYTSGLAYPLCGETLSEGKTRGISNVMEKNLATIRISDGALLCIHTRNRENWRKNDI